MYSVVYNHGQWSYLFLKINRGTFYTSFYVFLKRIPNHGYRNFILNHEHLCMKVPPVCMILAASYKAFLAICVVESGQP